MAASSAGGRPYFLPEAANSSANFLILGRSVCAILCEEATPPGRRSCAAVAEEAPLGWYFERMAFGFEAAAAAAGACAACAGCARVAAWVVMGEGPLIRTL